MSPLDQGAEGASPREGGPGAVRGSAGCDPEGGLARVDFRPPHWKRSLDLVLLALLIPCLLPVLAAVAAWIKLTSRGPVFFRQNRVGAGEREFPFYKFRSMRVDVETTTHEAHLEQLVRSDRPMTKLDALGDPRLIPGGNLLRASGLDELPQIWNVFRGEMSLVGPRPCTPKEFALYRADQKTRFRVLPGLTGYWQVKGKNKTTFTEMIELDSHYVEHCSLWLDLEILARTPWVLVSQLAAAARKGRASADGQGTVPGSGLTLETKS